MIAHLISDGLDIARLNFSHGSHEFHRDLISTIREEARKAGKQVAIMQDLQGPKLRVGSLPGGAVQLEKGQKLLLHPEGTTVQHKRADASALPISAEIALSISKDVRPGSLILFDDGKMVSRVLETYPPEILVEVEVGGKLTDHKGMNLPGTPLSLPCLCDKDLVDLEFGLKEGVDAVALSFVRCAQDIRILREKIRGHKAEAPFIVAKIEREEGIALIDEIIREVDGLLIARGDMAVEIGAERVPSIQKSLIRKCNSAGIPVITATQMLESMISCPSPTRAEASDVANAVFDGSDAVMLSGETASGKYPREAVGTMARIILDAEKTVEEGGGWKRPTFQTKFRVNEDKMYIIDAIEHSAATIATQVGAQAIACVSVTGLAVRALAHHRPSVPIFAITDDEMILRRLTFFWGVRGVAISKLVATDDVFTMVERLLIEREWADNGDLVVITAGVPTLKRGTTNTIKVYRLGAQH